MREDQIVLSQGIRLSRHVCIDNWLDMRLRLLSMSDLCLAKMCTVVIPAVDGERNAPYFRKLAFRVRVRYAFRAFSLHKSDFRCKLSFMRARSLAVDPASHLQSISSHPLWRQASSSLSVQHSIQATRSRCTLGATWHSARSANSPTLGANCDKIRLLPPACRSSCAPQIVPQTLSTGVDVFKLLTPQKKALFHGNLGAVLDATFQSRPSAKNVD